MPQPYTAPVYDLPSQLHWQIRYSEVIYSDPLYAVLQATPSFELSSPDMVAVGIVWDVFELIASCKRPGAYQLLTSDCSYAPDSGIEERVLVSYPCADTVVWELDLLGLAPVFNGDVAKHSGFVRLRFSRTAYEASIRRMLCELQACANRPLPITQLSDQGDIDGLKAHFPGVTEIMVDSLEPDLRGCAIDQLRDIDANELWARELLWPTGTVIEFGFFNDHMASEFMRVNNASTGLDWPGHYLTHWRALAAFKAWLAHAQRGFGLPEGFVRPPSAQNNIMFALDESSRDLCHAAGHEFARVVQQCYEEQGTAPGVRVCYREGNLPVATKAQ